MSKLSMFWMSKLSNGLEEERSHGVSADRMWIPPTEIFIAYSFVIDCKFEKKMTRLEPRPKWNWDVSLKFRCCCNKLIEVIHKRDHWKMVHLKNYQMTAYFALLQQKIMLSLKMVLGKSVNFCGKVFPNLGTIHTYVFFLTFFSFLVF